MSKIVRMKTRELANIASQINQLYSDMNNAYLETAALFEQALEEQFKGDKPAFMDWAQGETSYSVGHINRFLKIQKRFGQHTRVQQSENHIPIKVLDILARDDVPGRVVDRVVKMYQRTRLDPPPESEALNLIRESLPAKPKPLPVYNKPMAERIPQRGYAARAEFLLDVSETTSAETVRILARHWKNKYHPDKGGDSRVFNLIVQAEKKLLKKRGEK